MKARLIGGRITLLGVTGTPNDRQRPFRVCHKVMKSKTTMGTSKPYTRAMRGIVHEPQVNIGADQKFSPFDVFKKRGTNPEILMD